MGYFPTHGSESHSSCAAGGNTTSPKTGEYAALPVTWEHPHTECCKLIHVLLTYIQTHLLGYSDNPAVPVTSDGSLAMSRRSAVWLKILALYWPVTYDASHLLHWRTHMMPAVSAGLTEQQSKHFWSDPFALYVFSVANHPLFYFLYFFLEELYSFLRKLIWECYYQ